MFKYVVLLAFFALATAAPQGGDQPPVTILRSESENKEDGSFSWVSELSDGTKSEQSGYLKNADSEDPIQVIKGSYSYTSPEGQLISIKYIADENGFQPEGEHLPTPPPIPEAIQKALEIIYRNAEQQQAASGQVSTFHRPPHY